MIERFYIDNYRSFVNFELRPGHINLFLGDNGTGKSTVLELLAGIGDLLAQRRNLADVFPASSRTRWQTLGRQTVELDWRSDYGLYRYELAVLHGAEPKKVTIDKELLFLDGQPLYAFEDRRVRIYDDEHEPGASFELNPELSYLAMAESRGANTKVMAFKAAVSHQLFMALEPQQLDSEARGESSRPQADGRDFVAWYRSVTQERSEVLADLFADLRERMPGFRHLRLDATGSETRRLVAVFEVSGSSYELAFDELSTGQRALVVFYVVLHAATDADRVLLLDEPDNFLAVSEIQPWWIATLDRVEAGGGQLFAISHHPESMNYLGNRWSTWWFEREESGPIRARPLEIRSEEDGMTMAELVALGWVGGEG